jgi:hypothetical protein
MTASSSPPTSYLDEPGDEVASPRAERFQLSSRWWFGLGLSFIGMYLCLIFLVPGYQWLPEQTTVPPFGNDFLQEWVGGRMILDGQATSLYDWKAFDERQHDPSNVGFQWSREAFFPPVYPPPHYLLASALAWIDYRWAVIVWHILLATSLWIGIRLIARDLAVSQPLPARSRFQTLVANWSWLAFVGFPPLFFSILMGQKGPLWLLLLAATWCLLRRGKMFEAGVIFGLLSIKPTLFFLLPLVMLRFGHWRFIAGSTWSVATLWGGAWLLLPSDVWRGFADQGRLASNYAAVGGYHLDWSCNLIALANASGPPALRCLQWLLVAPLVLYVLTRLLSPATLRFDRPDDLFKLLLATFLLSPHAYYYDMMILMVPIFWYLISEPQRGVAYFLVACASVLAAGDFLEIFGLPLIPIVMVGLLTELILRETSAGFLHRAPTAAEGPLSQTLPLTCGNPS